jgi:DNA modification methylase
VKVQQPLLERYFTVKNSLIWDKNGVSMGDLKGAYASSYENILFAHKGRRELKPVDGQQRHKDILPFNRVPSCRLVHNHQKLVELLEFLIRKSSNEGDLVLVPFCGSGSEVVAAKRMGRRFLSFELVPEYVAIANERLAKEDAA